MTVLLLVFLSSVGALNIGFKMLEEARASTLASQILQSEIENLRLRNWTQIKDLAADPTLREFTVELDTTLTGFPKFACTRDFYTVTVDGSDDLLKQAVVSVAWTTNDGRSRTRRYMTYLAKDGINDYYYRAF